MKKKRFKNTLPSGLGISKSGRLQVPLVACNEDGKLNDYGQKYAQIGDLIAAVPHTGFISKNNIGKLVGVEDYPGFTGQAGEIELLDGTRKSAGWLRGIYVLNKAEYNDALKYLK